MKTLLIILLFFITSCGTSRRIRPIKPFKGQKFIGLQSPYTGIGAFEDQGMVYLGRFKLGRKEGLFKVIYPDKSYSYTFYKNNYPDKTKPFSIYMKDNKPYLGYKNSNTSIQVYKKSEKEIEVANISYIQYKKQMNYSSLVNNDNKLNYYKENGKKTAYFTKSGHSITYLNKDMRGSYKDIFGNNFKALFKVKNQANGETIYNEKFAIEISKLNLNGNIYEGETKKGIPQGFGYIQKDGVEIWGWFKDGKLHGSAILKDRQGDVYFGYYKNNKKHGVFLFVHRDLKVIKKELFLDESKMSQLHQSFSELDRWYKTNKEKPWRLNVDNYNLSEVLDLKYTYNKSSGTINPSDKFKVFDSFINKSNKFKKYWDRELGNHYNLLYGTNYKQLYTYFIYDEDKLVKQGKFKHDYKKACKVKVLKSTYYKNDCTKADFLYNSKNKLIHFPVIKNNELVEGYSSGYDFGEYFYDGPIKFKSKHGYGLSNTSSGYILGNYSFGFLDGLVKSFNKKNGYQYGKYTSGNKNGTFVEVKDSFETKGQYVDNEKQGQFKFYNSYLNITGQVNYKNHLKEGQQIFQFNDGSIYSKFTFVRGNKEGSALCYNNKLKKPENCEYNNGERIDQVYKDRMAKEKVRQKKIKREQEARARKERAERRRWERKQRRERAERKRIREQNRRMIQNTIRNSINEINQIGNRFNNRNNNFRNYNRNSYKSKTKKSKKYNKTPITTQNRSNNKTKASSSSGRSGSVLKLTATKPYKECIHEGSFMHYNFKATYDCNRREETFPKAKEAVDKSIAVERKRYEEMQERKRAAEERKRQLEAKRDDACREFASKNGHYCSSACDPRRFNTKSCKAISQ